ncbi:MAG: multicopper oxidase [Armatimonadota bacterium]|nr:multicopper oxidase [Armatimonadota bacterium]
MGRRCRASRRRQTAPFWLLACLAAIGTLLSAPAFAQAPVPLNPLLLTKYVDALPVPPEMPPAAPGYYEVGIWEISQQLHTDLPSPTVVWGYGTSPATASYPAATFEATRGDAIQVRWYNALEDGAGFLPHLFTVDQTLHWADPLGNHPSFDPYLGPVPTVSHLHGGEVRSDSDGHPEQWFLTGEWRDYDYPNTQEAATLWYHDHALGITRLNVYAGLAGFYLLRDPANEPANLPGPAPRLGDPPGTTYYEIPLVIQDRIFDVNGQFLFPDLGINPTVHPFWLPEFFGDAILVNGKVWPYLNVEPRRYRFRFLNGSNARAYGLRLIDPATGMPGPAFYQIGTDGGLLDFPVMLNDPLKAAGASPRLVLLPGERADVIIDFAGWQGFTFILDNDAKAPYPAGAPANPNTVAQIMQFRVVPSPPGTPPDTSLDPSTFPNLRPLNPIVRLPGGPATRRLTLNEVMGANGPLEALLDNRKWIDPVTESPTVGSTEVWEIINLTGDAHPIHLHLVQFQLLSRQRFQFNKYWKLYASLFPGGAYMPEVGPPPGGNPDPTPFLQQKPMLPIGTNEDGWKDTVRVQPGEVTRIAVRWAPQDSITAVPGVNEFAFDPSYGPGYVWHCHILDHEDNEMMRPYTVYVPPAP